MDGPTRVIAGAMSGTSADGVDVALVRIAGRGTGMSCELLHHHHRAYEPSLRRAIFALRQSGAVELRELARIGREISLVYAATVNEALAAMGLHNSDLTAVAAHGQTLFHDPPLTIQWLDPALVAAELGCPVISDFRRADCAAGGQGAPLVPFADYLLFRDPVKSRVLLNIGGIANITWLPAACSLDQVIAFDTGPGNCISDWICRMRGAADVGWDADGVGASRGRVIQEIGDRFLRHEYFAARGPRSTDGPAMIGAFVEACGSSVEQFEMDDLLATAAHVTAATIARAVGALPGAADEVLASGGGVHNRAIMECLRSMIGPTPLRLADDRGVCGAAKEAIAFALLGAATLDGEPANVPAVTGARRRVVLGTVTPRP